MTAITTLKRYPKESVGNHIVTNVPTVTPSTKIKHVRAYLEQESATLETVNYIYVLSEAKKLIGVVSIKEILRWDPEVEIKDIMQTKLLFVHPYTLTEKAVYLALEHSLKSLPILTKDEVFLGIMTNDTIVKEMYSELTSKLFKFAGLHEQSSNFDDVMHLSLTKSLKHRLPWILLGLMVGIIIAKVINSFEATLQENILLAGFIPLMVYMSSAVGTQTAAFMIRDFSLDKVSDFKHYFLKQAKVVSTMALLISAVLGSMIIIFYSDIHLASILALAVFLGVLSSIFTGLVIPYLFIKLKFDPANASGPIGTVLQDLTTVFIYLSVATMLLKIF